MSSKKKKNITSYKILISTLACVSIFSLIWISFWWSDINNALVIKNIVFSNTIILDEEDYRDTFGNLTGTLIDDVDLIQIRELVESHPYVRAARLSHRFPGTIVIEIVERTPIAILIDEESEKL